MFGFIQSGNGLEESFGFKLFVEYILVKETFKIFLERSNNISLHMEQYDYYLSAEYIDIPYETFNRKGQGVLQYYYCATTPFLLMNWKRI